MFDPILPIFAFIVVALYYIVGAFLTALVLGAVIYSVKGLVKSLRYLVALSSRLV